jgi:hypothetical protein
MKEKQEHGLLEMGTLSMDNMARKVSRKVYAEIRNLASTRYVWISIVNSSSWENARIFHCKEKEINVIHWKTIHTSESPEKTFSLVQII